MERRGGRRDRKDGLKVYCEGEHELIFPVRGSWDECDERVQKRAYLAGTSRGKG